MKTFIIKTIIILIWTIPTTFLALAQTPQSPKSKAQNSWEININSGLTSYYGDISGFDNDFLGKLSHESGLAGGFIVTKNLSPEFKFSAQLLFGNLEGRKENISISSDLVEYNIQAGLDILKIINSPKLKNLRLDVYGGIGNFIFNSTKFEFLEGETKITKHKTRVPEFVYILGSGLSYKTSNKISITLDLSIRQCQNDKVDIVVAGDDFDYYTYFNAGITYKIFKVYRDLASRGKYAKYNGNGRSLYRYYY
ncbi:MAG: hypothetical protein K9G76_02375 [Bacteroidales bacterium]|nr:hypothetical protein [Bacteroidales bacterium]MCF8404896.1 hypothetical protein [Bacteroidales bacterium]